MRVYVAVFVYKGLLEGLEVHTDPVAAQAKADEWKKQANPEESMVDVLEKEVIVIGTPIKELGLPWMYRRRLERNGIRTVEQLTEIPRRRLIFKRLIGEKCISLVKEALAHRGLSLADD